MLEGVELAVGMCCSLSRVEWCVEVVGEWVKDGRSVRLRQQLMSLRLRREGSSTISCCCPACFLDISRHASAFVGFSVLPRADRVLISIGV